MDSQMARGVLTETEVLLVERAGGKAVLRSTLLPPATSELNELLDHLWQTRVTEVWVMPATILSRTATCAQFEQVSSQWITVVHPDPREPGRPLSVLLWPRGSDQRATRRLAIVFPENAGWPWALTDARSLLATVTYLAQALGRSLIDSAELMAHQLLTELTRDYAPFSPRSSSPFFQTLASRDGVPIPLLETTHRVVWMRPLSLAEERQRYLHKYTHLSRDLEACLTVRLGKGTPDYSANGRAYDGIRPGIWRLHAERAGSIFDGKRLPGALDGEWGSTPHVKCCQDISYQVTVQEGYAWSQSQTLLTKWAQTLWQAAEDVQMHPQKYRHPQGRANATRTIMQLAERGVAILAREEANGGWGRPEWWVQVVGSSRALLFRHLAGLARQGTMPVLIDRDAFWVVSNDPNPLTAVPGLVTARQWRGYLLGYAVPLALSREVKAVFGSGDQPDQVSRTLDLLAGEHAS